jgi:O-antigen biosynthesis protein
LEEHGSTFGATVEGLERSVNELRQALTERDLAYIELESRYEDLTRSSWHQAARRLYAAVNRVAPFGTRRRTLVHYGARASQVILNEGWRAFFRRLVRPRAWAGGLLERRAPPVGGAPLTEQYRLWLRRHAHTPEQLRAIRRDGLRLRYRPTVSVVMPVYNTDPAWLREAIESVRRQLYDRWELCICDDGSTRPETREILRAYEEDDPRITVTRLPENRGIVAASNVALAQAGGEFVGLLDHDDELKPDALLEVVKLLNEQPDLDYIYTDEDKKEPDGELADPFFKPEWSPDLLLSVNYVTHFSVYRRDLVERLGGFRPGYDGSQDYDLVLRMAEATDRIAHIPKPLYTWRKAPGSAAASASAKPFAYEAAKRAIDDALNRRGLRGRALDGSYLGYYRVRYEIHDAPRVALVIPTRDKVQMLRRCVESIRRKSTYRNYEIIVVDNDSREPETLSFLASFEGRVLRYPHEFNFSKIVNFAAKEAEDFDYLLYLNNDTEVISGEWIEAMLEHAQRPDVAAVGARLLYPDGRAQHEGILVGPGDGLAGNIDHRGYFGLGRCIRNLSAVTAACMLVRRDRFFEVGGFDERLRVAYNDVDFCLRAREKGYLVVYTPYASLYHHEGGTRGRTGRTHPIEDEELFRRRWGGYRDPYYNPNLDLNHPYTLNVT